MSKILQVSQKQFERKVNMLNISDITVDLVKSPSAASVANTRFGWKIISDRANVHQTSYRVQILNDKNDLVFDSGIRNSGRSIEITFDDLVLSPACHYSIRIEITDNYGNIATGISHFSTELPAEKWVAKWIKPAKHYESWAPYIRKKFRIKNEIKRALLYASGLGCSEYSLDQISYDECGIHDVDACHVEQSACEQQEDKTE